MHSNDDIYHVYVYVTLYVFKYRTLEIATYGQYIVSRSKPAVFAEIHIHNHICILGMRV